MELYSPKSQKPEKFRKNTVKNNCTINVNKKGALTGSTYIFEINEEGGKPNSKKKKPDISALDSLKNKLFKKLQNFFEYEER